MTRIPHLVRAIFTVGLAWMILIGAINVGLAMPGLEFLRGFGGEGNLDYSHRSGFFAPLTRGFIARILGLGPDHVQSTALGRSPMARGSAAGTKGINIEHPFTNDEWERAYEVTSLPFRARTNTTGAKRQPGEPGECLPAGGTAWYRYTPQSDVALVADTFGTSGEAALGIYRGNSLRALSAIGCDRNVLGNAQVGFRASAEQSYYFQITSLRGGATVFELAAVGPTTIESLSPSGGPADRKSIGHPDIGGDGRSLAFVSWAQNLAGPLTDCSGLPPESHCASMYLRNRLTGTTRRIAETGYPTESDDGGAGLPSSPSMSVDGRYVAFSAFTFGPGPALDVYRGTPDAERSASNAYLYDQVTDQVELVSRNSAGEPARIGPGGPANLTGPWSGAVGLAPSVSADGRFISFLSGATNMGTPRNADDRNFVYHRDRLTGTTRLVNVDSSGDVMHGISCAVSGRNISGDGRYVVFMHSSDPSAQPTAGHAALMLVHLWDARIGRSRVVSKLPPGTQTRGNYCPVMSLDGSHVALISRDALVPEDTNGTPDVYVYEVETSRLRRVSVNSAGEQTIDPNVAGEDTTPVLRRSVTLSADGRYAVFDSAAPNLAPGAVGSTKGPPDARHIYEHDLVTGSTRLVSVSSTGEPLAGDNTVPYISADGRFLSFMNRGPSGIANVMVHELR